jgi:hypothetical protein
MSNKKLLLTPMPFETTLDTYQWMIASEKELDGDIHKQILNKYKKLWPFGFKGINEGRTWLNSEQDNPINVVIINEKKDFCSQGVFVTRVVTLMNKSYLVCGIQGVITQEGHKGLASRIVSHIFKNMACHSPAHIFMFFCPPTLRNWYEKLGFYSLPQAQVRVDPRNPEENTIIDDEVFMYYPLTEIGKKCIYQMSLGKELYFGSRPTW